MHGVAEFESMLDIVTNGVQWIVDDGPNAQCCACIVNNSTHLEPHGRNKDCNIWFLVQVVRHVAHHRAMLRQKLASAIAFHQ